MPPSACAEGGTKFQSTSLTGLQFVTCTQSGREYPLFGSPIQHRNTIRLETRQGIRSDFRQVLSILEKRIMHGLSQRTSCLHLISFEKSVKRFASALCIARQAVTTSDYAQLICFDGGTCAQIEHKWLP